MEKYDKRAISTPFSFSAEMRYTARGQRMRHFFYSRPVIEGVTFERVRYNSSGVNKWLALLP
jgi:hypothetical protein